MMLRLVIVVITSSDTVADSTFHSLVVLDKQQASGDPFDYSFLRMDALPYSTYYVVTLQPTAPIPFFPGERAERFRGPRQHDVTSRETRRNELLRYHQIERSTPKC